MAAYQYVALDASGRRRKGVVEADHPRQVRARLRAEALTPLQVDIVRQRGPRPGLAWSGRRIGVAQLALMTRQLATLLRAALPVEEALGTVAEQTELPRARALLLSLRAQVLEGRALGQAMQAHPAVFGADYCATVTAGEQTGRLDVVLERLADLVERRQQLQQKLVTALIYPLLLAVVAMLIVIGLLTYVVPQVVDVFVGMDQTLPLLTRVLIGLSEGLQRWGLYGLALLVVALAGAGWLLRQPRWRRRAHALQLRVPGLRRLIVGANTSRFTRTLSILIASGVPAVEAMRIGAGVIGNVPMREAVEAAAGRVREGASLFQSLSITGYFAPLALHLIASGEASGRLEELLERSADALEREQEAWLATLMSLLEPLMILVMGGLVLLIVLAIMLPVFNLNQMVGF